MPEILPLVDDRCVVLDTCFGTGEAFLRQCQSSTRPLHYLAFLAQPLTADQLAGQPHALRAAWPDYVAGFHRLLLDEGRISLTLMIGDLATCLSQCVAQVDAFLVDPLAAGTVARRLARLAAPHASLHLSAASPVAALEQAGFLFSSPLQATYQPRRPAGKTPATARRHAIVLGAGLAGAAICERLAARGWRLTLLERHADVAQEASGNLAGIVMPVLSQDDNLASRLSRAAYLFAVRRWSALAQPLFDGERCGVLQLARDAGHAAAQQRIALRWQYPARYARWLDSAEAGDLLNCETPQGGWLFAQGGWAHPAGVCRALLAACGEQLTVRYQQAVTSLQRAGDDWQLIDADGVVLAQAPTVIFANGNGATGFAQLAGLPLQAVRGQVTHVSAPAPSAPALVVCREGYLTPPVQGVRCAGATYDVDDDLALRWSGQHDNLQRVQAMLPGIWPDASGFALAGRVGFRCVAPDRLPLVGALPVTTATGRVERLRDVPRWPGLHGLLGYASRGLIWAPLAAELLAAQLEGEPLPLESDLADALDPARFRLKALRQSSG
ncbi:FAD-dependent 5-carboxymethylaminomethyl-2-thiouridine(34) oxidoreductase MnmC [Actimicrobium sp. CCC2.4]|uniref:FAD-dependent 5-carboxymethylaminomethyl-2-thiouridine(34) oxidoreductase MnmC n=1 Tax=Actimicrobium sp. CCC2.4 TaxID=3048606 RepID=UPI002AC953C6|nr:FAD-dependent 5-carboxymethylaminomethyl-2-thiouridine(34) oxidoreductase MnmC [Actimicrobium sp. CCC2.4]MEB0135971.1 FAD-dependent 5-carboxymethylaminomethyl-2-thiouridine(34) oxidoreductase MnmC [Actimicrobium sp. CCC2.4]WPX32634.1 FAD-dependent 5-carboxymethylaminomethyl-2-thiouridine(34) oxidoreductase MnmC [Actimicrobium sp. CCC2.4]